MSGRWIGGVGWLAVVALAGAAVGACVPGAVFDGADAASPDADLGLGETSSPPHPDAADTGRDPGPGDAAADAAADTSPPEASVDAPSGSDVDAANCSTVTQPVDLGAAHIDASTAEVYSSEPASSGPHFDVWTQWKEYTQRVPYGNYIHSLEHGAVVLAYKCPASGSCEPLKQLLRNAVAAAPDEKPSCTDMNLHIRWVIMPDELLDVPIASVRWGKLYKATCLDPVSLQAFVNAFGGSPEDRCDQGTYAGP